MYHTNAENVIYPNHSRTPNRIVRGLYSIGFFIADFGPMLVNLFNAIYISARKLFAFLIGLLIELSTIIVLIGTIAFSVFHSLELLRRGGAVGGMEYIGVIMFEIVFISSVATITRSLMNGERPDAYSVIGFVIGFLFVEWSNITGMAQNWTGWIIGFFTPILLIITEGILAYQFLSDKKKKRMRNMNRIIKKHSELTPEELEKAIAMYQKQSETVAKKAQQPDNKWRKYLLEEETGNGIQLVEKLAPKMVMEQKEPEMAKEPLQKAKANPQPPIHEATAATGTKKETTAEKQEEPETTAANIKENTGEGEKTSKEITPSLNQNSGETPTNNNPKQSLPRKEASRNDQDAPDSDEMRRQARMWAMKFYQETGKIPGRVRIANHTHCKDRIAREIAEELKKKYGKVS